MNIDWQSVIVLLIFASAVLYALRRVWKMLRMMRGRPGSSLCGTCGSCSKSDDKQDRVNVVTIDLPETKSTPHEDPGGGCWQRRDDSVVVDIPPASSRERSSGS